MPAAHKYQRKKEVAELLSTPVGFAQGVLGLTPYPWQQEILSWYADIWDRVRGAVAAPNGSGKSANVISSLSLWWLCMAPRATVVITSADHRQIDHQIWPAILRHRDKFPSFNFIKRRIVTPSGGELIAFVTDEPGRAEGWHMEKPDKPLLLISDEAKSVPDVIFQAQDRCTFNGQLLISSTGLMEGGFWKAMTGRTKGFLTRKVKLDECPHVDPRRIASVLAQYGPDHYFTKSTLFSEFMSQDDQVAYFFHRDKLLQQIAEPPDYKASNRCFYCDFAGGGSENVIAKRVGNKVSLVKCWREPNEMAAAIQFIRELRMEEAAPEEVYGDAAGTGRVMIARMAEAGYAIHGINGCESAWRDLQYGNRSAEMWDTAARSVENHEVIMPDDDILTAQLCSRRMKQSDRRGRILCESKDDMAHRGVESPDRADAVVAVVSLMRPFLVQKASEMFNMRATKGYWGDWKEVAKEWDENTYAEGEVPPYYVPGSYAGL